MSRTQEQHKSDNWLCELRRQAEEKYAMMQRQMPASPCPPPPSDARDMYVFSAAVPASSHGVCVTKDMFRPAFKPVGQYDEMLITPCLYATKNNSWECGNAPSGASMCCSRTHQSFDNMTKNKSWI